MEQLRELRRPDDSLRRAARELAAQHQLAGTPGRGRAIHRHLERLDREFASVYRRLQSDPEAVEAQPRIAEWLLDNNSRGDTPNSLQELPPDTLAQWRDMRDRVAQQSLTL